MVAVVLSAFVLVNAFVVGCGGGGSSSGTQSNASTGSETPAAVDDGGASDNPNVAMGKQIYTEKCTLCHGPTGHGDGPGAAALDPKPRNHTDGSYMNARTNEELEQVIKNGKGQMPAWGATLSDEQIVQVLSYVRTLAVPPYTGPMP